MEREVERIDFRTEPKAAAAFNAYKVVVARAVEVFGDDEKAAMWLSRNNTDFEGRSPLQTLAESGYNPDSTLLALGQIEHGVYF